MTQNLKLRDFYIIRLGGCLYETANFFGKVHSEAVITWKFQYLNRLIVKIQLYFAKKGKKKHGKSDHKMVKSETKNE